MFKDDYKAAFSKVTASEDTYRRVMYMTKEKKKQRISGVISKVLIAVAMISLLTVTASASEVVRNWFTNFFSDGKKDVLSQKQVEYIADNEKHINQEQTQNGWRIELRSAMTDGTKGYILLGVAAPENQSLMPLLEASKDTYIGPENDYLPKTENKVLDCSVGLIADIGSTWQEDGDGLKNTLAYVIDVTPDPAFSASDPFAADVRWSIHIENIVKGFPEQELVAEGMWDFSFTFEKESREIELLKEPVKIRALANLPEGTSIMKEVTLTSLKLRAFGVTVSYGDPSDAVDYDRASIDFTYTISGEEPEKDPWIVVMKDGSKQELIGAAGNPIERYLYLEVTAPIILDDVDYILLSDGTKLDMPVLN